MISLTQIIVLVACGFAGLRLWQGTTSLAARAVTLASLAALAWSLIV